MGSQAERVICVEGCRAIVSVNSDNLTAVCYFPSFGGLILSKTVSKQQYKGMAVFTPVICGRYLRDSHVVPGLNSRPQRGSTSPTQAVGQLSRGQTAALQGCRSRSSQLEEAWEGSPTHCSQQLRPSSS